jgi:hypothetical protein
LLDHNFLTCINTSLTTAEPEEVFVNTFYKNNQNANECVLIKRQQ